MSDSEESFIFPHNQLGLEERKWTQRLSQMSQSSEPNYTTIGRPESKSEDESSLSESVSDSDERRSQRVICHRSDQRTTTPRAFLPSELDRVSEADVKRRSEEISAIGRDHGIVSFFQSQHDDVEPHDSGADDTDPPTDSERGDNVLDCARRPQRTETTRPRGRSGKRKSYTDKEYRMIINAPDNIKRRTIADALEMPWKTALDIMSRYQKNGSVHDQRHERLGTKAKRTAHNNPYSAENRGKWGKLSKKYATYLFHLVHFNCAIFATDLLDMINREILRDFLLEHEVMPVNAEQATAASHHTDALQHGIVLGIQPLREAERQLGGPLDTTPFEQHEEYKKFYKLNVIRSPQTIRNHLQSALYTRKSIIIEKATANTPKSMAERLEAALALRAAIDGKVGKVFLIFQDEMPFYLNQHRKQGISRKGERAVYRGPPTSNMSFRTQLSMAVHPTLGIFAAKQYNPKKIVFVDKKGKEKTKWKSGYGKKEFEDFLHLLLSQIMKTLQDEDGVVFEEISESRIYLFYDGAPEHGRNAVSGMISRFPEKQAFDDLLHRHGCTFEPIKLSPNSPHLNLCEYYNRMLRVHATRERNMPEVHKLLQLVQGDKEAQVGNIIQNRVDAIHGCIERALDRVRANPQALGNFNNFSRWVQKVIDRKGYLNYYEPM